MTDREYVKFNTSIQTATNSSSIQEDENGNIPAVIELSLPENIFTPQNGSKQLDNVSMLTTKLRASLSQTPIAQLPLDLNLSTEQMIMSTCQLDVYPYCLLDDNRLLPEFNDPNVTLSLPYYKSHKITYVFRICTNIENNTPVFIDYDTFNCIANTPGRGIPVNTKVYNLMKMNNLQSLGEHNMNLCISTNHGYTTIEDATVYINNISSLQQILQDALENAITYANTSDEIIFHIDLIKKSLITSALDPQPISSESVFFEEVNDDVCIWKYTFETAETATCRLKAAVKPIINLTEQSLSIAYDSAPFDEIVPVIWNTAFVETYDTPEQMRNDTYRKNFWVEPVPKRRYKYGVDEDLDKHTYNFTLVETDCKPMNIIVNKELRDVFSFLPWVEVDTKLIPAFSLPSNEYEVSYEKKITTDILTNSYRYLTKQEGVTINVSDYIWTLDQQNTIFRYSYIIDDGDEDIPQNRHDQSTQYIGTPTGDASTMTDPIYYEVSSHIVTSTPQTSITETYITHDDSLNPGTTTLFTDTTTNTQRTNYDPEIQGDTCALFYLPNGTIDIGYDLRNMGRWTTNVMKFIPTVAPSSTMRYPIMRETMVQMEWNLRYSETLDNPSIKYLYNNNGDNIIREGYQETITTTTTTVDKTITFKSAGSDTTTLIPNLTVDNNNKFYILDGTPSHVELGQQEVVKAKDSPDLYTVYNGSRNVTYTNTSNYADVACKSVDPSTGVAEAGYRGTVRWKMHGLPYGTSGTANYIPDCLIWSYYVKAGTTTRIRNKYEFNYVEILSDPSDPLVLGRSEGEFVRIEPAPELTRTSFKEYSSDGFVGKTVITETETGEIENLGYNVQEGGFYGTAELSIKTPLNGWIQFTYDPFGSIVNPELGEKSDTDVTSQIYGGYETDVMYVTRSDTENITIDGEQYTKYTYWFELDMTSDYNCEAYNVFYPGNAQVGKTAGDHLVIHGYTLDEYTSHIYNIVTNIKREDVETGYVYDVNDIVKNTGNIRLTFSWDDLPTVVLSPIQSFVLVLQGVNATQEMHPINISEPGGSSLTSIIPIVENYYLLANTLRDLHDELVVTREGYSDSAFYSLTTTSGQERNLVISLKYITKDSKIHQVYIPKNGVFSLQLTFGLSYYLA